MVKLQDVSILTANHHMRMKCRNSCSTTYHTLLKLCCSEKAYMGVQTDNYDMTYLLFNTSWVAMVVNNPPPAMSNPNPNPFYLFISSGDTSNQPTISILRGLLTSDLVEKCSRVKIYKYRLDGLLPRSVS